MAKDKILKRELARLSLKRMEEAARSVEDFNAVGEMWDKLEANWERKERYHGVIYLADVNWVLLKKGNYLDIIFDSAEEIYQLIEDIDISRLVNALRPKPKDVLYLSAVKLFTIQQIALVKGQTDRNILKMRTKMMDKLRNDLSERLIIRIKIGGVITTSQRKFLQPYIKAEAGKEEANGN